MSEKKGSGGRGQRKILVIDDDSKYLKLVKDLLEVAGFKVILSEDAETGIAAAKEQLPDLILMDYQLPGLDGLQASKILKKDEATKNIPLVFITASVTEEEKKLFIAEEYPMITKPINTRTFVETIEKFLK